MNKAVFLNTLERKLQVLAEDERKDIINEYTDYINQRIYDGENEINIINDFGDIDEFVTEILSAYHISTDFIPIQKKKIKKNSSLNSTFSKAMNYMGSVVNKAGHSIKENTKNVIKKADNYLENYNKMKKSELEVKKAEKQYLSVLKKLRKKKEEEKVKQKETSKENIYLHQQYEKRDDIQENNIPERINTNTKSSHTLPYQIEELDGLEIPYKEDEPREVHINEKLVELNKVTQQIRKEKYEIKQLKKTNNSKQIQDKKPEIQVIKNISIKKNNQTQKSELYPTHRNIFTELLKIFASLLKITYKIIYGSIIITLYLTLLITYICFYITFIALKIPIFAIHLITNITTGLISGIFIAFSIFLLFAAYYYDLSFLYYGVLFTGITFMMMGITLCINKLVKIITNKIIEAHKLFLDAYVIPLKNLFKKTGGDIKNESSC